jgi:hypothetical protein
MFFSILSLIETFLIRILLHFSYTSLIIAIQQILEYDNVNRLSDGKVCLFFIFIIFFFINLVT